MAASDINFVSGAQNSFKISEFLECYKLPKCAKVVGYRGVRSLDTPIKCGDYICLQTLAVDNVSLSFYDEDTGSKREVRVPADSNMKFTVIPNLGSGETQTVMRTVADVIDACPMKFRANAAYDDPYLPTIFKKGEEFRYLRKSRCPSDGTIFLECEDASGNVLQLPRSCRGDFSLIEDDTSYSLREIISFGPVSRKLRLSSDNIKLAPVENKNNSQDDSEQPFYANMENNDGTLSRITGLPLTFNGIITMGTPELFLLVSPRESPLERWKVPLDLNVDLIMCPDDEYEEPAQRERNLCQFVSNLDQDFPVVAEISRYEGIPNEFRKFLRQGLDILIHEVETSEKILAKCKSDYFCIGRSVNGRFRKELRRFKSVSEFKNMNKVLTVKVMEDIASDVPEPFSLKVGDLLRFENFNIQSIKIRYGKKIYCKCDTVMCEQIAEGKNKQLRLPVDLDVFMIEILPDSEKDGDDTNYIFSKSYEFPVTVDYLPFHHCSQSILPFDSELELVHRVSDPLVLISPLGRPVERNNRVSGLDAKVGPCLLVPVRHQLFLKLKSKLHFPPNYFRLPKRDKWITLAVEAITEEAYNKLVKYNDQAYEDYDPRSQNNPILEESPDEMIDNTRYKQLRRVGASMTILPQLRKHSKNLFKKDKKYRSDGNLADDIKTEEKSSEPDDERIYELYEAPSRVKESKKTGKTLKSKLKKRLTMKRGKDSKE